MKKKSVFTISFLIYFLLIACTEQSKSEVEVIRNDNVNAIFTENGFGGVEVNQRINDEFIEIENSRVDNCFFAKNRKIKSDVDFQVLNNKISVISSNQLGVSTNLGIKVGDEESKIYEKYKNSVIEKKINPYGESQNDYSIIIWNHDKTKGTRYDIESKKIIGIKVGDTNLTLMEGCA